MRGYAERQGRVLDEAKVGAAMTWADPVRDVSLPRDIALRALEQGQAIHCVWTGQLAILAWWDGSYLSDGNAALQRRFTDEVRASLPAVGASDGTLTTDEIHAAIALQRLRLHQDQQVPEWSGNGP